MSQYRFKVSLNPINALASIQDNLDADLVYQEQHDLDNGRVIGTLVFERYFFRVESRVALVVIIDNIYGSTNVRVVATGSSQGLIFNFDWGASDSFAYRVKEILKDYITGDIIEDK